MRAKIPFMLLICIALSMINTVYATSENPKSSQTLPSAVTVPDDFSTLQEALNNAEHGATVYLKEGVYSIASPITIAQNVSIIGIGKPTVEFSGEGKILVKTGESVEVKKDAPNVTLEGIKFIGKYGESEFKELEKFERVYKKIKEDINSEANDFINITRDWGRLLEEVRNKAEIMSEKYVLISIIAGSLSMKNCTASCDSGAALLVVGDKSFFTAADTLFEKNGFDAVVVTESEVSFDSCTFTNNRSCPVLLKQDAKGVLTNCTIKDSLTGLRAIKDCQIIVENALVSGCLTAISCCDDSTLRLTKGELINNDSFSISISGYCKALVTRTVFLDASVHIATEDHSQAQVYDSTFSNGNVSALINGQKAVVQFDDNCKFHNMKYKQLEGSTIYTSHDKSLWNLLF